MTGKVKVATGQKANKKKGSLVKVVVEDDQGSWVTPPKGSSVTIEQSAVMPSVRFEIQTVSPGPYKWKWSISWDAKVSGLREASKRGAVLKTFSEKGEFETNSKFWDVTLGKVLGGRLRVEVKAGDEVFKRYIDVRGVNPTQADLTAFVSTLPDTQGFDRLLEQESRGKHFIEADGQPIVSFDKGYGITQMTNPAPSFEQVWSWKENVRVGAVLYQQKQKMAKAYLSQKGRTYSSEQLRLETWSRWNGGPYHVWSEEKKDWVRSNQILCDSETGNIGWDMDEEKNKGQTVAKLHERDQGSYANPKKDKKDENKWKYTGVCYADHVDSH